MVVRGSEGGCGAAMAVVAIYLVLVHCVHEWLGQGDFPDAGHVESVDVIPPVDLVVLVLPAGEGV